MKRCATYTRYSPRPSAEDVASPEVQNAAIAAYCRLAGLEPTYEFSDAETSARKIPLGQRVGGAAMLGLINGSDKNSPIKHVVVKNLSRAFRNTIDGLTQLDQWDRQGVTLHLADQGGCSMDCSTATGRLLVTLLLAVDQFEPMQTAERTSASMKHQQSNGKRMSAIPPTGKMIDPSNPKLLIDNPPELASIDLMVKLHGKGWSVRKICGHFNRKKMAGRKWNHVTIGKIIKNASA